MRACLLTTLLAVRGVSQPVEQQSGTLRECPLTTPLAAGAVSQQISTLREGPLTAPLAAGAVSQPVEQPIGRLMNQWMAGEDHKS